MNWIRRAVLYNARKKGKTLLLFLLLLVIGILLLICFSVQRATKTATLNVRQSLKGAFSIDAGASGGQLTEGVLQAIRQLPGITGYNGRSASYAEYLREDGTPLQIRTEGAFQVVEGFEHAGKVVADSFTEKDEFFTEKGFEIEEGSPVTEGGKHAAVIHRWLAEENDLQIGDTILLSLNEQMVSDDVMTGEGIAGKSVQAEIKGIFESTEPQEDEVLLSHVLYENTIFIDVQSYCELFPEGGDAYFESADFQVDDPEKLDALIQQIRELEGVSWDQCTFTKHAVDYENARKSLEALEQIVVILSLAVPAVSAALLILILAMWMRGRVHETGVYLAMGIGRWNILLQHLAEVCLTAVCAFAVAAVCSRNITGFAGEYLLKQAAAPEYEAARLSGNEQTEQTEDPVELTQIQVGVNGQDILFVYGAGTVLIIFSVTAAGIPVLRLKPKEILTKMN